jgi:tetratricopeptide (TPR) repeat protein
MPRSVRYGIALAVFALLLSGCAAAATSSPASNSQTRANDLLNAGLHAQVSGDAKAAISDYNQVIALDSTNKYAYYNLGLIAQQQNRSSDAEKYYRTALIIDPNYQPAIFNLAVLQASVNPWESVDLYMHLIELSPSDADAYNNLGFALKSLDQTAEGNADIAYAARLKDAASSPSPSPAR